jgi:ketopantoate reductase
MSEGTASQPCEKLKESFVEKIAPKMEALVKEFSWGELFGLFDDVVQAVEEMEGVVGGAEKKECAIDIILAVYDKYQFDIPYLPNMFEKQMLKLIVEIAIDGIVEILNRRGIFVHGAESSGTEAPAG